MSIATVYKYPESEMQGILCAALWASVINFAGALPLKSAKLGNGQPIPPWSVCKEASGHVKAVSKTMVTISDWNKPTLLITLPVYGQLAEGSLADSVDDRNAYRVQDLKIGDGVTLYTLKENNVIYCVSICIRERPGGLIPKSQKPKKVDPWHEMQNVANTCWKAGIPNPRLQRSLPEVISLEENDAIMAAKKIPPAVILPSAIKK